MLAPTKSRGWWLLVASLLLSACGGGSGNSSAGIDRGGVRTPTYSSATITGFGSVIVRGTPYSTGSAAVVIDGEPSLEAALGVGQVVGVSSEPGASAPTAARIELDHDIIGPIESFDLAGSLLVLGQTVRTDLITSFDRAIATRSLEGLTPGDVVAISGFHAADGSLLAGRIERAAGAPLRVHGFVQSLDSANGRFRVNALTVDYSVATSIDGFPAGQPRDGDFVLVTGVPGSSGTLRAERVRLEPRAPFAGLTAPFDATLEGLVTRFASSTDFDVDGQRVSIGAGTVFQGGTAASIGLGRRVTVTGTVGAGGSLAATTLVFAPTSNVRLQAPIAAVDVGAGTIDVLGTTIRVLPDTYVEDLTGGERTFTLADLVVGDWVGVSGYQDPASATRLIATRVTRDNDDDDDIEIIGPITTLSDPEFTILAVRVLTNGSTEFDDIDRAVLFAGPPGRYVEVEGVLQGNLVVAEEVEPVN